MTDNARTLPDDPNHPARWYHRRRMAYLALYSMLVVTALMFTPWVPLSRLEKLADVIEWFYFSMASIVGAYMGFASWSAKTGRSSPAGGYGGGGYGGYDDPSTLNIDAPIKTRV